MENEMETLVPSKRVYRYMKGSDPNEGESNGKEK